MVTEGFFPHPGKPGAGGQERLWHAGLPQRAEGGVPWGIHWHHSGWRKHIEKKLLFYRTFAGLERGRISPCSRACHCPASCCLHCAVYHRCCPGLGSTENSLNCFTFTFNVQDSEHSDASVAASAGLIGDLCSAFGGGKMDGDHLCTDIWNEQTTNLTIYCLDSFDLLASLMLPQVAIVTLLDVEPISDLLTAGRRSKTSKTKTLSTWATKEIRYLHTYLCPDSRS